MKDNFSTQSKLYAQYRPVYPKGLYEHILPFVKEKNIAWDCGTGNGQVAIQLAKFFNRVYATDISAKQIEQAPRKENIIYKIENAEHTELDDNHVDLVTIGQAIHWFDFDSFYREVIRTSKHGAIIAVVGYGLVQTNTAIQTIIDHFYRGIIGPYWDKERRFIDENYQTIPFPFEELPAIPLHIKYDWNFEMFTGYLQTWSAVQHYIKAHQKNPVEIIKNDLQQAWGNKSMQTFSFPVLMRLGRIDK